MCSQDHQGMPANLYNDLQTQDEEKIEIRLVTLDGIEEATGEVVCRLDTVRLNDAALEYHALSYCWGDPEPPSFVKCNGFRLRVTRSLTTALESLLRNVDQKLDRGARTFWIDAICINQGSIQEREKQVTLMGDIYRDAKEVVVWLGPAADNSDLAFRACRRLYAEDLRRRTGLSSAREMKLQKGRGIYWSTRETYAQIVCTESGKPSAKAILAYFRELDAVQAILMRPWWARVWIIQEITLARELVVLCGDESIKWDMLDIGLTACMRRPLASELLPSATAHCAKMLFQVRHAVIHHEGAVRQPPYSLAHLLGRFRWSKATNAHDKIYGLLGLATIGQHNPLTNVSYSNDIRTCYRDAVIDMIKSSGSLDILQLCRKPPHIEAASTQRVPDLPTWVPSLHLDADDVDPAIDLSRTGAIGVQSWPEIDKFCAADNPWNKHWRLLCFAASGGSIEDEIKCERGRILVTEGFVLDQIQTMGEMQTGTEAQRNSLNHQQYLHIRRITVDAERVRSVVKSAMSVVKTSPRARRWKAARKQARYIHETLAETSMAKNVAMAALTGLKGIFEACCQRGQEELRTIHWKRLASSREDAYPTEDTLSQAFVGTIHKGWLGDNPEETMERYKSEWRRILSRVEAVDRGFLGKHLRADSKLRYALAYLIYSMFTLFKKEQLPLGGQAIYKCFTTTKHGYFALVPPEAREGDMIALLKGGPVPFVLRKTLKYDVLGYEVIGSCYVHGAMHGEQWNQERCQPIRLV